VAIRSRDLKFFREIFDSISTLRYHRTRTHKNLKMVKKRVRDPEDLPEAPPANVDGEDSGSDEVDLPLHIFDQRADQTPGR
jgi:hypothetical protein